MGRSMVDFQTERLLLEKGIGRIAGVDEAGRGPLAGPVVAAAVVFAAEPGIHGIDDSKKLTPRKRELLFAEILKEATGVGIGIVSPGDIDRLNIYRAAMEAMRQAVAQLAPPPGHLLIDGPRYHDATIPFTALIGGDGRCISIAAASIIAKVTRDRIMLRLDEQYPAYGFARHKGYGTAEHLKALEREGPCEAHRKSFRMPGRSGGA
jgi:ribonuclease HII